MVQAMRCEYACDFAKHATVTSIRGKGRGLLATRDLPLGTVVLINPALACATHEGRHAGATLSRDGKSLHHPADVKLRSKVMHVAAREPLVAATLLGLDDNHPLAAPRRKVPLVELRHMQQLLSEQVLPLLPSTIEYFPAAEKVEVSAPFVDRVCDVNCHGRDVEMAQFHSSLFPVASLMNHSDHFNCMFHCFSGPGAWGVPKTKGSPGNVQSEAEVEVILVWTCRAVVAGEELTVQYHEDKKVVKGKWGI